MTPEEERLHREIAESALKSPEKRAHPLYRWFLVVAALLVIVIFLLVYLGNGQSLQYIQGRIQSTTLNQEYVLSLDNGREVHFTKSVYMSLVYLMRTSEGNEFKACLLGTKQGALYDITGFYVPKIYGKAYDHVIAEQCNDRTLIPLHSHPVNNCVFSDQDIKSYEQFRPINPDALIGIMCGVDRFSFYG